MLAYTTVRPWESALRAAMMRLNYNSVATAAAVAWLDYRGSLSRCPIVEPCDIQALDQVVVDALQRQADRQADLAVAGSLEQDPRCWPAWTDAHVFEPTDEDRLEAAASAPVSFQGTVRRSVSRHADLEQRAGEAAAVAAQERGLAAPDARRRAGSRVVPSWNDADQRRHHGGGGSL